MDCAAYEKWLMFSRTVRAILRARRVEARVTAIRFFFVVSESALTMLSNAVPFVNPNRELARGGAVLALAVSVAVLGACAGSTDVTSGAGGSGNMTGAGGSSSGNPDAGHDAGAVPLSCDNSMLVLENNCIGCHSMSDGPFVGGLDLETAGVAQRLVGKPTATMTATNQAMCAGKGNLLNRGTLPAKGILIDKINQLPGVCGNPMPLGGAKLQPEDLDCLQAWANGLVNSVGP